MADLREKFIKKVCQGNEFFDILVKLLDEFCDEHGRYTKKGKQISSLTTVCGSAIQAQLHKAFMNNGRTQEEASRESGALMELLYLGEKSGW